MSFHLPNEAELQHVRRGAADGRALVYTPNACTFCTDARPGRSHHRAEATLQGPSSRILLFPPPSSFPPAPGSGQKGGFPSFPSQVRTSTSLMPLIGVSGSNPPSCLPPRSARGGTRGPLRANRATHRLLAGQSRTLSCSKVPPEADGWTGVQPETWLKSCGAEGCAKTSQTHREERRKGQGRDPAHPTAPLPVPPGCSPPARLSCWGRQCRAGSRQQPHVRVPSHPPRESERPDHGRLLDACAARPVLSTSARGHRQRTGCPCQQGRRAEGGCTARLGSQHGPPGQRKRFHNADAETLRVQGQGQREGAASLCGQRCKGEGAARCPARGRALPPARASSGRTEQSPVSWSRQPAVHLKPSTAKALATKTAREVKKRRKRFAKSREVSVRSSLHQEQYPNRCPILPVPPQRVAQTAAACTERTARRTVVGAMNPTSKSPAALQSPGEEGNLSETRGREGSKPHRKPERLPMPFCAPPPTPR